MTGHGAARAEKRRPAAAIEIVATVRAAGTDRHGSVHHTVDLEVTVGKKQELSTIYVTREACMWFASHLYESVVFTVQAKGEAAPEAEPVVDEDDGRQLTIGGDL